MADIAKIAEDLSNLTVLEAAELATMLEEKWGVSAAAAPMAVAMPAVDDVRGKLVGLIQAPAAKIARVTQAPAGKVARVIKARGDQLQQGA